MPPTWRRWFTAARSPGSEVREIRREAQRRRLLQDRRPLCRGEGGGRRRRRDLGGGFGGAEERGSGQRGQAEGGEERSSHGFPFVFACANR